MRPQGNVIASIKSSPNKFFVIKFSWKLQRWCFSNFWFFLLVRLFASQTLWPKISDWPCNNFKTNCKTKFQFFISQNDYQSHDLQRLTIRCQITNKQLTSDKQPQLPAQLDTNQLKLFWTKMNFSISTSKCFKKNGKKLFILLFVE